MANGAVYGIVPFINEKRTGMIAGVVGAGGNLGGMIFGFLFRSASLPYAEAFGGDRDYGCWRCGFCCVSCGGRRKKSGIIVAKMEPTVEGTGCYCVSVIIVMSSNHRHTQRYSSICCYCGVGCGVTIYKDKQGRIG